jgi:hypothetical protein
VSTRHAGLLATIRDTGTLPDDDSLAKAVDAFHESFVATLEAGAEDTVVVETSHVPDAEVAASE